MQWRVQEGTTDSIAIRKTDEIASRKTDESNVIHHDFVHFAKQHSRFEAHVALHCFVTAVLWSILHLPWGIENVMRLDC